jgi:hypothetical protein
LDVWFITHNWKRYENLWCLQDTIECAKVIEEQDWSVPVDAITNIAGPSCKDEEFVDLDISLAYLNKSLVTHEEPPVAKKRLHVPSYGDKKLREIRCLKEKY